MNTARKEYRRTATSPAASIQAGRNGYINATLLNNNESIIEASQNLILTGKRLNHTSGITGTMDTGLPIIRHIVLPVMYLLLFQIVS